MRINPKYLNSLLGVLLALTACNSEELTSPAEVSNGKTVNVSLTVNRPSDKTRTTLEKAEDGRSLTSVWDDGDQLVVINSANTKVGTLSLISGENTKNGVFNGTLSINEKETYTLWYLGASNGNEEPYAKVDETSGSAKIVNKLKQSEGCTVVGTFNDLRRADLMKLDNVKLTVVGDKAYSEVDVTLAPQNAMIHFNLSGISNITTDDKLTVSYGDYKYTVSSPASNIYLPIIPGSYTFTFNLTSGGKTYTASVGNNSTIEAGKYYAATTDTGNGNGIEVKLTEVSSSDPSTEDDDLVGPVFEVEGKKFRFTRANLQYNTTTKKYLIPEKQTDYTVTSGHRIGWTNTATGNPEYIGLFRWGATGIEDEVWKPWPADYWSDVQYYKSAANIHGTLPCQTSGNNATISSNKTLCPNGQAQDTPYDWGKAYSAQKGGTDHYFTLTSKEIISVIDQTISVCGTVDKIEGLVILPFEDVEEAKTAITAAGGKYNQLNKLPKTIDKDGTNYGSSDRSKFAWTHLTLTYEQLTALNGVFLPAAGLNNPSTGKSPNLVSSDYSGKCYYWTSTPTTTPNAIHLHVNGEATTSNRVFKVYGYGKGYGLSVRLVKEIKDNTSTDDTVVTTH